MKAITQSLLVLLLLLVSHSWLPHAHAEGSGAGPPRVQLFLPTDRRNPADGRSDALRLEFGEVELTQMGDILKRTQAVLPSFDADHPPTIPFYISRRRSPEEQARMVAEARAQFQKAYPGVEPKIQVRYLEEENVNVEALSRHLDEKIDELAKNLPDNAETRAEVQALHEANRKALLATLEAAKKHEGVFQRPSLMRKIVRGIASVKAVLNFGARAAEAGAAGNQGAGPLLSGLALVGTAPALEYFGTRFETELAERFSGHALPISSERPVLKALNRFYTHNKVAKFIKGATGNALAWGIADPAFMQMLGHFNNPGAIPMVSGHDLGTMALTSFPSAFLYMGGYLGMESLRQKGWMTQPALDLALRSTGVIWQMAEFILSTGNPKLQAVALPLLLGPLWTGLAGATLLGLVLPAQNHRLVLVDEALGNRDDINALEALDSTKKVGRSPAEIDTAVKEVHELDPLKKPGRVRRFLGQTCRAVFRFFGGG